MSCSYWDESAQQWAFDGIESSLSENTLSCASTHLTTFGGILQINPYVEPLKPTTGLYNTISLDDASEFLAAFVIADNITVTAIVGTMLCANLLSLFWYGWYRGYRARRRRAKLGKSFEEESQLDKIRGLQQKIEKISPKETLKQKIAKKRAKNEFQRQKKREEKEAKAAGKRSAKVAPEPANPPPMQTNVDLPAWATRMDVPTPVLDTRPMPVRLASDVTEAADEDARALALYAVCAAAGDAYGPKAEELAKALRDCGTIAVLTKCIDSESSELQQLAMSTLGNLLTDVFDPNARETLTLFLQAGGLKRLRRKLKSDYPVCVFAAAVLQNLTSLDPFDVCERLRAQGCERDLKEMRDKHDDEIVADYVLAVLANLRITDPDAGSDPELDEAIRQRRIASVARSIMVSRAIAIINSRARQMLQRARARLVTLKVSFEDGSLVKLNVALNDESRPISPLRPRSPLRVLLKNVEPAHSRLAAPEASPEKAGAADVWQRPEAAEMKVSAAEVKDLVKEAAATRLQALERGRTSRAKVTELRERVETERAEAAEAAELAELMQMLQAIERSRAERAKVASTWMLEMKAQALGQPEATNAASQVPDASAAGAKNMIQTRLSRWTGRMNAQAANEPVHEPIDLELVDAEPNQDSQGGGEAGRMG